MKLRLWFLAGLDREDRWLGGLSFICCCCSMERSGVAWASTHARRMAFGCIWLEFQRPQSAFVLQCLLKMEGGILS